tara:strand:+ start:928 stop:1620 length:693 start_codon:yes stop_codon:yes gene_type:complete
MPTLEEILKANPGIKGGIGHKAASAALAAGYTPDQIAGAVDKESKVYKDLTDESITQTSMWGQHDTASDRGEFVGQADVNFMRSRGVDDLTIQSYMSGKTNTDANNVNYNQMLGDVKQGATIVDQGNRISGLQGELGTLQSNYSTLQSQYNKLAGDYDAMGSNYTQLQKDVAQAQKDAMKIKYTGSTQVSNPSAMGIQAASGQRFRGSGLAGTASLARPSTGMKIKTLNV